jgi:putative hydrolase of the HAD superfamily
MMNRDRLTTAMTLKAIAFDWGHTLMDERADEHVPIGIRPVHLMPGVAEVVRQLACPLAVWANTRGADESAVRAWLGRAGLGDLFRWVITSVDAGARKPRAEFFHYALARCQLTPADVLFVGNQLNTDIAGAEAFGIRTVWLSGAVFRSLDDGPCTARPTYSIDSLYELAPLVRELQSLQD